MSFPRSLVRASPSTRCLAKRAHAPRPSTSTLTTLCSSAHHSTHSISLLPHARRSLSSSPSLRYPPRFARQAPHLPPQLSPEEQRHEDLKELGKQLQRSLKANEIPQSLPVRPFLPDSTRPGSPLLYKDFLRLPEVVALLPTHTPVLIHLALAKEGKEDTYSICRLVNTVEQEKNEAEDIVRAKIAEKQQAASKRRTALGANSGLRNQSIPKELEATWVMSDNDLNHRTKQARQHLENAFRVTIHMGPKRTGRKLKPSEDHKQEMLEKVDAALSDIAEKWQPDVVKGMVVSMYYEPKREVRKAVAVSEKSKQEEEARRAAEEERKAELRKSKVQPKAARWKPGQPIPTAAALTSNPETKY